MGGILSPTGIPTVARYSTGAPCAFRPRSVVLFTGRHLSQFALGVIANFALRVAPHRYSAQRSHRDRVSTPATASNPDPGFISPRVLFRHVSPVRVPALATQSSLRRLHKLVCVRSAGTIGCALSIRRRPASPAVLVAFLA